jgi:hypothetical protein
MSAASSPGPACKTALVPFCSIDAEDVRRAGEADLEALRRRAAHAGPIGDDTLLYRIEFHAVP